MNFITVIKDMKFDDDVEGEVFEKMALHFEKGLPKTLYQDPYELMMITGISSDFWKRFLKIPQVIQLIESEVAMLSEVKARSALSRLGEEDVDSADVAAIRALLDKSKLLQDKMKEQKTIIFHHIPLEEREDDKE